MDERAMIFLRTIVFLTVLSVLTYFSYPAAIRIARVWTPVGIPDGALKLPGNAVSVTEAASNYTDVFAGEVTETDSELPLPRMSNQPNLYRGMTVTILAVYSDHKLRTLPDQQLNPLRGAIGDQTSVGLRIETGLDQAQPKIGSRYIFIAAKNKGESAESTFGHVDKEDAIYIARKLLPITDNNVAIIKKLMDRRHGFSFWEN
jgi:hypothetical protein